MDKIIIDPHHCSAEEYEALIEHLLAGGWDFMMLPKTFTDAP